VLVADPIDPVLGELGRQLAVGRRDGEQLDPGDRLGRAALVDVDVRGLGADRPLPRPAGGEPLNTKNARARSPNCAATLPSISRV